MKKVSLLLVAFALVMGLSQCRKPNLPVINPGETQHVVLNASWDNGGSKLEQEGAGLKWKQGDKLTVSGCATGDLYCSSPDDGVFEGEITKGSGEKIKFTFGEQNFTEQTGLLDDAVSLTSGELDYKADGKYGTVSMTMPHAVMKLDLSALGTADGTTVTINELGGGTVASVKGVKNDEASKALYVAVEAPNAFGTPEESLVSRKYEFESSVGVASCDGWKLKNNTFYTFTGETGAAIVVTPTSNPKLLSGKFSISATEYVQFSRGNLQFKAGDGSVASPEWRFAEHQYDYIGNAAGNTTAAASRATQSEWIDLFGWGATGRTDINTNLAQPYESIKENSKYKTEASATANETLTRENGGDWGVCMGEGWLTLSTAEWQYLFGSSAERNGKYKFGVNVCDKANCLILVPDVLEGYTFDSGKTSYNAEEWATAEAAGLVCLPPLGWRGGCSVTNSGVRGYYWSSSAHNENAQYAYYVFFKGSEVGSNYFDNRYEGRSVRLVQKFCKLEFVDLGLESGTLWSETNLNASSATEYGLYYQFGSTTGHDNSEAASYSTWSTAPFNGGSSTFDATSWNAHKASAIDSDGNLKQEYDVAYQQTNGVARIPTRSQFAELIALTNEWTSNYDNTGVPGRIFYGNNGKTLFIPAAGCYYGGSGHYVGNNGVLIWSRTVSGEENACYMSSWDNSDSGLVDAPRYYSYPIRPVKASGE